MLWDSICGVRPTSKQTDMRTDMLLAKSFIVFELCIDLEEVSRAMEDQPTPNDGIRSC